MPIKSMWNIWVSRRTLQRESSSCTDSRGPICRWDLDLPILYQVERPHDQAKEAAWGRGILRPLSKVGRAKCQNVCINTSPFLLVGCYRQPRREGMGPTRLKASPQEPSYSPNA